MKRKKIIVICCLAAFLFALTLAGLFTFTYRQSIVIHASIYDVANQFNDLQNWKHWHPAFTKNDTALLRVKYNKKEQKAVFPDGKNYTIYVLNPAAIALGHIKGSRQILTLITAISDNNGSFTIVGWTEKVNAYNWLKKSLFNRDNVNKGLENLKMFMEDDSRRYGFFIKIKPVTDTLILTRRIPTAADKVKEKIPVLLNQLQDYIAFNNIPAVNNYYYTSVIVTGKKQVELAVGIPVHKTIQQEKNFEFLKLPAIGKLLTGIYQGTYAGRLKLYTAMDKYISDKRLKKVAQPLEQYGINDITFSDSSQVTMTLFYPIY